MRQFYNLEQHWVKTLESDELKIENSILIDTQAKGQITNCILMGSRTDDIDMSNSVVIGSVLSQVRADQALMYNCTHLANMNLPSGEVVADIFLPPEGRVRMETNLDRDGKEDWETVLPENACSFAQLAQLVEKSK